MPTAYKIENGYLAGSVEVPDGRPAPPLHTFVTPPVVGQGQAVKFRSGRWIADSLERKALADRNANVPSLASRREAKERIDREAATARERFITAIPGQEATYLRKETEARDVLSGGAGPHPYLDAEAVALEMTVTALAQEVVDQAAAWDAANVRIEALRRSAKIAVDAAQTNTDMEALFPLAWPRPEDAP